LRNIDIEAAFTYLTNQTIDGSVLPVGDIKHIIGPLHFHDLTFNGEVAAKPVQLKLGSLASRVPLDAIKAFIVSSRGESEPHQQNLGKLLPLLGGLENMDVVLGDMDFVAPSATISLQNLALNAGDWQDFIPSNMVFNMDGLVLHMTHPPEEIAQLLSSTGYDKIEASAKINAQWDKDSQKMNLEDLSFRAENIGDFSLTSQLDGVDLLPLVQGEENVESWLQKLRLHNFDLKVRDRGAIANFVTIIAGIGGVEPEEISQGLEDIARGTPIILFEDEILSASATQALLSFLQKSGLLWIHVASRQESGLAFEQIMGDEVDWQSLLAVTDIRFTHEDAGADSL